MSTENALDDGRCPENTAHVVNAIIIAIFSNAIRLSSYAFAHPYCVFNRYSCNSHIRYRCASFYAADAKRAIVLQSREPVTIIRGYRGGVVRLSA